MGECYPLEKCLDDTLRYTPDGDILGEKGYPGFEQLRTGSELSASDGRMEH